MKSCSLRLLAPTVLLGALVGPGGAGSAAQELGVVHGRIEIGVPITTRRPTSAYSRTISAAGLAPASEVGHVVVYVRDAPTKAVRPTRVAIRQQEETFLPRVVAVPVGSEVEFPNDDLIYHNVFSLSRARVFDLGRYPHGQSRRVLFTKPGVIRVFCQIHSHMTATVMVFDHPWFAVPSDGGRYELPAIPPGDIEITAWHERLGDTTMRVRVAAGGATSADFVLPVPRQ